MAGSFSGCFVEQRGENTNITLLQGATISLPITISDTTIIPASAALQARSTAADSTAWVSFTVALGRVSVAGQTITFSMTAAHSAALPAGTYVYDAEVVDSTGATHRILSGNLIVSAEVTRL
jgi:heme/copper-type cytochrome/quinol oxidase subunit 3